jgi:NDP-sugar pyrophosphorylase family protein
MRNIKLNIIIPMAGAGSRFGKEYPPKPFVLINKKPMIQRAIESLGFDKQYKYIFYIRTEMMDNFKELAFIKEYNHDIIEVKKLTEGCASTCLLGVDKINNQDPLIIMNCDQIMAWNGTKFINHCTESNADGVIVTYYSQSPKNSYVKVENDAVTYVAEKTVISTHSTNGISYWKHGIYFVESCVKMIANNDRTNNEFYVAPSYNYLINDNYKIINYAIGTEEHHPVGTPEDLEKYLKIPS